MLLGTAMSHLQTGYRQDQTSVGANVWGSSLCNPNGPWSFLGTTVCIATQPVHVCAYRQISRTSQASATVTSSRARGPRLPCTISSILGRGASPAHSSPRPKDNDCKCRQLTDTLSAMNRVRLLHCGGVQSTEDEGDCSSYSRSWFEWHPDVGKNVLNAMQKKKSKM